MKHRTSKLQKEIIENIKLLGDGITSTRIYERLMSKDDCNNKRVVSASLCRSLKSLKEKGIIDYEDRIFYENTGWYSYPRKHNIRFVNVNCPTGGQLTIRS